MSTEIWLKEPNPLTTSCECNISASLEERRMGEVVSKCEVYRGRITLSQRTDINMGASLNNQHPTTRFHTGVLKFSKIRSIYYKYWGLGGSGGL